MKKKWILLIFLIIIIIIAGIAVGFLILPFLNIAYTYSVENAFPNLSFNNPVGIYDANDGTDRLFVVEQGGIIWTFNNNRNEIDKYKFLDISDQIVTGGERGLLGLAFHPNYEVNGYLYVYYTKIGNGRINHFTL